MTSYIAPSQQPHEVCNMDTNKASEAQIGQVTAQCHTAKKLQA